MGLSPSDSASIAMVGGADGPMVLFASLNLSKEIFVPITVVASLYLGLTYGGYPYLVRAMVPKRLRAIRMKPPKKAPKQYGPATKISFAVVMCVIPKPVFSGSRTASFFLLFHRHRHQGVGAQTRERLHQRADALRFDLLPGHSVGILCDAHTLLDPGRLKLQRVLALLISGHRRHLPGYAV